jgi:hypothetical protein
MAGGSGTDQGVDTYLKSRFKEQQPFYRINSLLAENFYSINAARPRKTVFDLAVIPA